MYLKRIVHVARGTMIYIRRETTRQAIIAHRRQFLFLASLSSALALFFMLKAVSLMFEDFVTIS
jgi:hypothetical protein